MKLSKFRVQNYKKIDDTGWIKCSDLTTFVGKNEAGKSALFRGLSKLNPSDEEEYDGLKEFPRRRYSAEFKQKDWIVSSAEFVFSDEEKQELSQVSPLLRNVSSVICSKSYSGKLTIDFQTDIEAVSFTVKSILQSLNILKKETETVVAPTGKGELLSQVKSNLVLFLQQKSDELSNEDPSKPIPDKFVNEICGQFNSQINEDWQQTAFEKSVTEKNRLQDQMQAKNQLDKAEQWVQENIPQFLYFDRYDVIDSAIHIGEFVRKLKETPDNTRLRTTQCLFDHVGLSAEFLLKLDPNKPDQNVDELRRWADERAINLSSASAAMTQKFADWWEQRKHKFRYQIDGQFFRVWVSDDLDPSEIELDQRSQGMQYFFSFYLVFLEEATKTHLNSILLLDEPGLHYHGTAQMKTVQFLRKKLSDKNQVLYTTHSPFMIDGDHFDDTKVVYEDDKTGYTKVSDDVWPTDKESLFPLQAGLGYTIAQTLFQGKKQLIVEGLTDYSILKAMNQLLAKKKMKTLKDDIIITPAGGISHLMPLASLLVGNDVKMAILLDADKAGINKQKDLKEKLLLDCVLINSLTKTDKIEIEDLFPEKLYLEAVKQEYKDIDLTFTEEEKRIPEISKRVQALFKRKGQKLEKWIPANVLLEWIQLDSKEHEIQPQTCKYFESIFESINKQLK